MSERVGSGKQGTDVSKNKESRGLLSLTIPTLAKEKGVEGLLCGTFHTKPEFAPLWGSNFPLGPHICFLFLRNPN
jgi:hypothetical protein